MHNHFGLIAFAVQIKERCRPRAFLILGWHDEQLFQVKLKSYLRSVQYQYKNEGP